MNLNEPCSKYFKYIDFVEASDTQKRVKVNNTPKEAETFRSIKNLATEVLDPVVEKFGPLTITYGFCSHNLQKHIRKDVSPKLDQHAGSELNSKGNLICPREGFAVDFKIQKTQSSKVANFIMKNTKFDRLYFYGNNRPLHVSAIAKQPSKLIYIMKPYSDRRVPLKCSIDNFSGRVAKFEM